MRASTSAVREAPEDARRPARPGARAHRAAALGVAAVLCVFFAPALVGPGEFVYRDTGRLHAPMKRWIGDELRHGRFPQWNPHAGIGTPVVATATDAVMHPFTLLAVSLPQGTAVKAWVLLSFALAAAGAFLWVRALGGSPAACAVGALGFALSGPLVSSSDNLTYLTTYATLPWVFLAADRHRRQGGPAALLGVAAASALCAAAGDPQAWGIAIGLLPVQAALFADPGARRAALARGGIAALAGAIAAAPFVLPVALWVPHSQRAAGVAAEHLGHWSLGPARLVELAVPELLRGDPAEPVSPVFLAYGGDAVAGVPWFLSVYLGAGVLLLAAVAAVADRRARLLLAGALAFAWAALGAHAGFGQLAAKLPVLSGFRYWEKVTVWAALLGALAAARGVDALLAGKVRVARVARAAGIAAAVLLAVAAVAALAPGTVAALAGGPADAALALAANVASGAARAGVVLAVLGVVAGALARGRLGRAAPLAIAAVVAVDLFGGNAGAYVLGPPEVQGRPPLAAGLPAGARVLAPFAEREDRWPERGRLGSTWEWLRRTLAASWNVPLRVGSPSDYVGLRSGRWKRIATETENAVAAPSFGRWGFGYLVVPGRSPEVAARAGVAPPYTVVASDPELPASLVAFGHRPRAYLAGALRSVDEEGAMAFALDGRDDGETVIEAPVPEGYAPGRGEASIASDAPGETVVRARADGRALLVLSDLFAPGWTAEVDGRTAEIVRANAVARGVWLDAGAHEVRFRYRTPGLLAGWVVALAGAAALGAWWGIRRAREGSA